MMFHQAFTASRKSQHQKVRVQHVDTSGSCLLRVQFDITLAPFTTRFQSLKSRMKQQFCKTKLNANRLLHKITRVKQITNKGFFFLFPVVLKQASNKKSIFLVLSDLLLILCFIPFRNAYTH